MALRRDDSSASSPPALLDSSASSPPALLDDRGFTLIELLVVVIIIGILAAVAIPVFLRQKDKGEDAAARSDTRNMATAEFAAATDHVGIFVATVPELLPHGFRPSHKAQMSHGLCLLSSGARVEFVVAARWGDQTIYTLDSSEGAVIRAQPTATTIQEALTAENAGCDDTNSDIVGAEGDPWP